MPRTLPDLPVTTGTGTPTGTGSEAPRPDGQGRDPDPETEAEETGLATEKGTAVGGQGAGAMSGGRRGGDHGRGLRGSLAKRSARSAEREKRRDCLPSRRVTSVFAAPPSG